MDEYICLDQLSGNLLVSSALNHGLSSVLGELLQFSGGSEFYKKGIPEKFIGHGFREIAKILHDEDLILMAVETFEDVIKKDGDSLDIFDKNGNPVMDKMEKFIINPQKDKYPGDYIFKEGDSIFLIAVNEPTDKEMEKISDQL